MDHLIEQCSGIANPTRLNRKFHIVVIYETFVSAVRALRACELLRQEIPPDIRICINAWRIESLHDHATAQLAASSAAHAELLIVSTPGRSSPPAILHEWMNGWLDIGVTSPPALFSLFGDHLSESALASALALKRMTTPLGIDFFMHPTPSPDSQPHHSLGWQNNHLPHALPALSRLQQCSISESAFDTIEDFCAHLRALFLDLSTAEPPTQSQTRLVASSEHTHR
jgi:hypothetical protein